VHALARERPRPAIAGGGITFMRYALEEPLRLDSFAGAAAIIHCAFARNNYVLNVAAAERLLAASRVAGIAQNVFLSSLSAREGARSEYGRQKYDIERLFLIYGGAVVRAGLVVGDGGLFASMRAHVRAGWPVPVIGDGRQPIQIIALPDLVRAIEIVLARELRGCYIVAHPDAIAYREFYRAVAASVGTSARFVRVPYSALSVALFVAEKLRLEGALPVNRDTVRGLRAMTYVDPRGDLARFALAPKNFFEVLQELSVSR